MKYGADPSGRAVCDRSLAGIMGSNPAGAWMSVFCGCCVLLGRGLCDGPIPVSEKPYRVCVCVSLSVIRCYDSPLHLQRVDGQRSDEGRKEVRKKEV